MREKIPTVVLMTILFSSIVLVATGSGGVTATKVYIEPKLIDNRDMSLSTIEVDVMVANVEDLYTWGVGLRFAPLRTILAYYSTSGQADFLSGPGVKVYVPDPKENIPGGTLYIGATRWWPLGGPGVSGSGKLATVTFNVLEAGECAIEVFGTTLKNSKNELIPHNEFDGYYKGPVAQLVRKELPLGRDISLAEVKKQRFLSSVKNFAEVPLYVKTKVHMVRDDGKVIDLWSGLPVLAYVDGFAYDTVPVRSYHGGMLLTDLSVCNWDMNGTLNEIDGGMVWTQRIYPEDLPIYTIQKYVKRRDTPVVGAVAGTGDGVTTTFRPSVFSKYIYHWTWYVDGVPQVEGVDYNMTNVVTYEEDGKFEYCSTDARAEFFTPPPSDSVVTVDFIWREYNYIGVFSFEDVELPSGAEIGDVFFEIYAASDGDNNVYRCMVWDGTTWKLAPPYNAIDDVGDWGWYTSKSVKDVLDTEEKINAAKIVISFDYDDNSEVPMWIDCMRLKITFPPKVVQPDEVIEIPMTTYPAFGSLTTADIGTYTCEATCYFSYYGNKFIPSTKTSTFTWWVTE